MGRPPTPVKKKIGRPRKYDFDAEAIALLEYARKPNTHSILAFGPMRGYSTNLIYHWAERHAAMALAIEQAKQLIGSRLIDKLIAGRSNPAVFLRYIGLYDIQLAAYERAIKQLDAQSARQINILVRGNSAEEPRPLEHIIEASADITPSQLACGATELAVVNGKQVDSAVSTV
jgi:hypothetical protein